MTAAARKHDTQEPLKQEIVVEEVFPHPPGKVWKALTDGRVMGKWLMEPTGFEPVKGNRFTFRTTPGGQWDGTIHCQVLEVVPNERFVYAWKGGHESNVGYGAPLDTVVTFTLARVEAGTRLKLVHTGFVLPKNETAYRGMSGGWVKVVGNLRTLTGEKK